MHVSDPQSVPQAIVGVDGIGMGGETSSSLATTSSSFGGMRMRNGGYEDENEGVEEGLGRMALSGWEESESAIGTAAATKRNGVCLHTDETTTTTTDLSSPSSSSSASPPAIQIPFQLEWDAFDSFSPTDPSSSPPHLSNTDQEITTELIVASSSTSSPPAIAHDPPYLDLHQLISNQSPSLSPIPVSPGFPNPKRSHSTPSLLSKLKHTPSLSSINSTRSLRDRLNFRFSRGPSSTGSDKKSFVRRVLRKHERKEKGKERARDDDGLTTSLTLSRPSISRNAYTSPLPLITSSATSTITHISTSSTKSHSPISKIPAELILHILALLIETHVEYYKRCLAGSEPGWFDISGSGSSNGKKDKDKMAAIERMVWVGWAGGVRDLVRFTRISKFFLQTIHSSPLFASLPLSHTAPFSLPTFPQSALISLVRSFAGGCLTSLDVGGLVKVGDDALLKMLARPRPNTRLTLPSSNITRLNLSRLQSLTAPTLIAIIKRTGSTLKRLELRALGKDTLNDAVLEKSVARWCNALVGLDVRMSKGVSEVGLMSVICGSSSGATNNGRGGRCKKIKYLRFAGISLTAGGGGPLLKAIGKHLRSLEVLDMSLLKELRDEDIEGLVDVSGPGELDYELAFRDSPGFLGTRTLTPREAGHYPNTSSNDNNNSGGADASPILPSYTRRLLPLRHLLLSSCTSLTSRACMFLSGCVPILEFFEMANIGPALEGEGVCALLGSCERIRRVDLEGCVGCGDDVLEVFVGPPPTISPAAAASQSVSIPAPSAPPTPLGSNLTHLILSSLPLTNAPLQSLITTCTSLTHLEVDHTRVSQSTLRLFVSKCAERGVKGAVVVAVDCRSVGEGMVRDLLRGDKDRDRDRDKEGKTKGRIRTRVGERSWECVVGGCGYFDSSETTEQEETENETDHSRIVFKSFWSWSAVDAARARREAINPSSSFVSSEEGRRGWFGWRRGGSEDSGVGVGGAGEGEERGCVVM